MDFRYSNVLVYNTFPVPYLSNRRKKEIEMLTYQILDIREEQYGNLADLYGSPLSEKNPKSMIRTYWLLIKIWMRLLKRHIRKMGLIVIRKGWHCCLTCTLRG